MDPSLDVVVELILAGLLCLLVWVARERDAGDPAERPPASRPVPPEGRTAFGRDAGEGPPGPAVGGRRDADPRPDEAA